MNNCLSYNYNDDAIINAEGQLIENKDINENLWGKHNNIKLVESDNPWFVLYDKNTKIDEYKKPTFINVGDKGYDYGIVEQFNQYDDDDEGDYTNQYLFFVILIVILLLLKLFL